MGSQNIGTFLRRAHEPLEYKHDVLSIHATGCSDFMTDLFSTPSISTKLRRLFDDGNGGIVSPHCKAMQALNLQPTVAFRREIQPSILALSRSNTSMGMHLRMSKSHTGVRRVLLDGDEQVFFDCASSISASHDEASSISASHDEASHPSLSLFVASDDAATKTLARERFGSAVVLSSEDEAVHSGDHHDHQATTKTGGSRAAQQLLHVYVDWWMLGEVMCTRDGAAYRHVYGLLHSHVDRHVYRHVCTCVHRLIYLHLPVSGRSLIQKADTWHLCVAGTFGQI